MKKIKEQSDSMLMSAKALLLSSIGRLPTALVIILLASLAMSAVTAAILIWNKPTQSNKEFLPLRMTVTDNVEPINPKSIHGTWIYQTPTYAMTLTFVDDRFEWIVLFGAIQEAQFYARGNYLLDGDVLVLGIRPDLGSPYDASKPWVKFLPIGMTNVNIRITVRDKKLIWDVPKSEQKKIIAEVSGIFFEEPDGHFEWVRP